MTKRKRPRGWRQEYADPDEWTPYVYVDEQRQRVGRMAKKLLAEGRELSPGRAKGRALAQSFWGRAWCRHLERLSDIETRLPRGRSYLRNGAVLDLKITTGRVEAQVMGSHLYEVTVKITPLDDETWHALKERVAGEISTMLDLLEGKLSDRVMVLLMERETGLFPELSEIKLGCSCPDYADMCKHAAAALYGVGARLDDAPELLFQLRGVDHQELLSSAVGSGLAQEGEAGSLGEADLGDLFDIDLDEGD